MDIEALKVILELGMNGVLLVLIGALWKEHQNNNAFIRQMLLDAAEDREALYRAMGTQRPLSLTARLRAAEEKHRVSGGK
jgi:hypothetical protein